MLTAANASNDSEDGSGVGTPSRENKKLPVSRFA
jgi:hypothetical protein